MISCPRKIWRNMKHVYTLNGTVIPTIRAICVVLENYQQKDGSLRVPLLGFEPRLVPPQGTVLSRLDYRGNYKFLSVY